MSAHESLSLVCRLFASGAPLHQSALPPQERCVIPSMRFALRPVPISRYKALCPFCHLSLGFVCSVDVKRQHCRCPDCGSIPIKAEDLLGISLDEKWLKRKLRLAMNIASHDGVDEIAEGIWRIGNTRRDPVVLARSLEHIWRDPSVLDRVRASRGKTTVITPVKRKVGVAPLGDEVTWLPLQERFAIYGSGLSFIEPGEKQSRAITNDPAIPVHGPFSEDFRWVTLQEWPHGPIRLTKGQAAIFRALWSFAGVKVDAQRLMARAGLSSAKPIDLFKVKAKNRGNDDQTASLTAYRRLVFSDRREGMYWLRLEAMQ